MVFASRHFCRAFALTSIASAVTMAGCGKPPGPPPTGAGGPTRVQYIVATPERLSLDTELPGRVSPVLIAEVRPQVNGLVQTRAFTEGSDVKQGQLLYQIDSSSYQATADNSKANLARAQATENVNRLKSQRTNELVAIKAVSLQDADDAAASLKESRADVLSAKAQLQSATVDLDHTRITAPISGRIGRSSVTPGALVTANQSDALATIQQLDPVYIDLTFSSALLLKLKQVMAQGRVQQGASKVKLLLDDGSTYPHEGTLKFGEASVETGTSSVTLRAEFPNAEQFLLPGMYVRAVIEAGVVENALLVPQRAVTRDPDGHAIGFIVTADNKLERRELMAPRAFGDRWLVVEGLKAGEKVAVVGQEQAQPGQPIETSVWQPAAATKPGAEPSPPPDAAQPAAQKN